MSRRGIRYNRNDETNKVGISHQKLLLQDSPSILVVVLDQQRCHH